MLAWEPDPDHGERCRGTKYPYPPNQNVKRRDEIEAQLKKSHELLRRLDEDADLGELRFAANRLILLIDKLAAMDSREEAIRAV